MKTPKNEIAEAKVNSLSEEMGTGRNFFEGYAESVSQTLIVGKLLKFSKGDWTIGQDNLDVAIGTEFACDMSQFLVGWIKWQDNKPVVQHMGAISEGYRPETRAALGDHDENQWEIDLTGKPRDPWQFSNYLVMKDAGERATPANLYTFATSSRGGINALAKLARAYGERMRVEPDVFPVIAIDVDSYDHPNRAFGRIKIPVLEIVGWEDKDLFTQGPDTPAAARKPKLAPVTKARARARA